MTPRSDSTPLERVEAAYAEYVAWRPRDEADQLERAYARGDRHGMAVSGLIGYLRAAMRRGDTAVPAVELAAMVEWALTFAAADGQPPVHLSGPVIDVLLGGEVAAS